MEAQMAIQSLGHARQLLRAGLRRRVVSVSGAESLADVAALGRLLYRAHHCILPKTRRWEVLGYRRIINLGTISGIFAKLRRRYLPRLRAQPYSQARIQRVRKRAQRGRALSFRVGGGVGHRSGVLADRLLLLADHADAHVLAIGPFRQRIHHDCEAVREELERAVDMSEPAPAPAPAP